MKRKVVLLSGALILGIILLMMLSTGCSLGRAKPTPTPTKTPKGKKAEAAVVSPTATSQPTSTLTPAPSPTPTPMSLIPTAEDVCPLTGLKVDDASVLERRPLAIKVSNAPPVVRPQAGLSFADWVFEHYAEAGLTRFTAIYLSHDAEWVGSVRSARLIDLALPRIFKAALVFSGASGGVKQHIREAEFFDRVLSPDFGMSDLEPPFARIESPEKSFEHTLFANTQQLWEVVERKGLDERQELSFWAFSEEPPPDGRPTTRIVVPYRPEIASAEYEYDPEQGLYLRSVLGAPHLDELTGEQLTAANVVVLYVNHVDTDIVEDSTGSVIYYSIEIQLWGQQPATVYRDGMAYDVQWVRPSDEDPLRITDFEGDDFPLKPGTVWVQVVPLGFQVESE